MMKCKVVIEVVVGLREIGILRVVHGEGILLWLDSVEVCLYKQ